MGDVYLILGASSEIGMSFLKNKIWKKDDYVVAHYCHSLKLLESVKAKIPCEMKLIQADFLSNESLKEFIVEIKSMDKMPTHILHIPSIPVENKRFVEYEWEDVESNINVEVRSIYKILQTILPEMKRNKYGKIVTILSSYVWNVPPKYVSAYLIGKYTLLGLVKAVAVEYAAQNIQINAVSPSMMETKFLLNMYKPVIEQAAVENPMGRNAMIEDVIPAIEYLLSEKNQFMTGVNIPIAGGMVF